MRSKKILLTIFTAGIFSTVHAANTDANMTDIGRYLTVANKPSAAQSDLLSQTIQVRFPQNIQTIGDAMQYLLRYSGYSLVDNSRQSTELKNTLTKPLPLVDREFQAISLKDALTTLAGPAFTLVRDDLNREVDFHVKPSFAKKIHRKAQKTHSGN